MKFCVYNLIHTIARRIFHILNYCLVHLNPCFSSVTHSFTPGCHRLCLFANCDLVPVCHNARSIIPSGVGLQEKDQLYSNYTQKWYIYSIKLNLIMSSNYLHLDPRNTCSHPSTTKQRNYDEEEVEVTNCSQLKYLILANFTEK